MSDIQDRSRGEAAKRLLGDPLYVESFNTVRARLQVLMLSAATDEATLKAKQCIGLLNDLQGWLARVIQDGEVASKTIEFAEAQARAAEKQRQRRA